MSAHEVLSPSTISRVLSTTDATITEYSAPRSTVHELPGGDSAEFDDDGINYASLAEGESSLRET